MTTLMNLSFGQAWLLAMVVAVVATGVLLAVVDHPIDDDEEADQ